MKLPDIWSNSIRNQLMISVAFVHALLMTFFVVDITKKQAHFLHGQSQKQSLSLAKSLGISSTSWILANDIVGLEEVVSAQTSFPELLYAMIISQEGRILAHNDNKLTGLYLKDKLSLSILKKQTRKNFLLKTTQQSVDAVSPIFSNEKLIGYARVGIGNKAVMQKLSILYRNGLIYVIISIIIGLVFAYFLSNQLMRQLLDLISFTKKIKKGIFSERFRITNQNEISKVGQSFNQMLSTIVEKTQEKDQALKKFKDKKEQLNLAMFGNNDGIWDWNILTNEVHYSKRWKEMLGYNEDEIKNYFTEWENRVHPNDIVNTLKKIQEHLEGKNERFSTIHRLKHKDGHYIPISTRGKAIIDKNGKPIRMVGTHTDFTEQIKRQQELLAAKKSADHAVKIKSYFLANMSHEIRTPLNAVIGLSQIMQDDKNLSPDQSEIIKKITFSADNLMNIINDILDFSKLEEKQLKIENVTFNLTSLLKSEIEVFSFQAYNKNISLNFELQEGLEELGALKGDIIRLQQILNNLLSNAIKFTNRGSVKLKVDYRIKNNLVSLFFSIVDTGIGIANKNIKKIFSSFAQEDQSITRRYGGTGLGLAISSKLLKLMNSELNVKSILGEGSTFFFTLTLPLSNEDIVDHLLTKISLEHKIGNITQVDVTKGKNNKILLVEDNPDNIFVIQKMLEAINIDIDVAYNGTDALKLLTYKKFELIFMDMQMPVMDGITATQEIRKGEKKGSFLNPQNIIVAMTANAQSSDRQNCLAAGMNDFISKPFKKELLIQIVRKYLNKNSREESA